MIANNHIEDLEKLVDGDFNTCNTITPGGNGVSWVALYLPVQRTNITHIRLVTTVSLLDVYNNIYPNIGGKRFFESAPFGTVDFNIVQVSDERTFNKRYIIISNLQAENLTLCEVQVYGYRECFCLCFFIHSFDEIRRHANTRKREASEMK